MRQWRASSVPTRCIATLIGRYQSGPCSASPMDVLSSVLKYSWAHLSRNLHGGSRTMLNTLPSRNGTLVAEDGHLIHKLGDGLSGSVLLGLFLGNDLVDHGLPNGLELRDLQVLLLELHDPFMLRRNSLSLEGVVGGGSDDLGSGLSRSPLGWHLDLDVSLSVHQSSANLLLAYICIMNE